MCEYLICCFHLVHVHSTVLILRPIIHPTSHAMSDSNNKNNDDDNSPAENDNPGEATLLVSEFPPPPFYYQAASQLTPPPIPLDALKRGTTRAAAAAARARAESERIRLNVDSTDAILGGTAPSTEEEEGDIVAVFGEIVEDPVYVEPLDPCENPQAIRDEVKRLNRLVVKGFAKLVHELVHNPVDNKYVFATDVWPLACLRPVAISVLS